MSHRYLIGKVIKYLQELLYNMNHVVIMAGGVGSRFWPLSTPEHPKQFIDILGCGHTLIQLTVARFQSICPYANFWVVTNEKYVDIIEQQIPTIPSHHILAEPTARNTAPCIAWACWCILQEDSDANVVVTPSDAVVMNSTEFQRVINNALLFTAHRNVIVTIGIKPNRLESGYGYIQFDNNNNENIYSVVQFREKPSLETAKEYLTAGNYLWNAGVFVWNIQTITSAIAKYKPNIAAAMNKIFETGDVQTFFPTCENISIDYAVIEPAATEGFVYTHPADFGWSDLGNWQSLHEKLMASGSHSDSEGNGAIGNVHFYECSNCVVHVEDAKKVVLQGLNGYIISEKGGRILVCKRNEEQRIREFSVD